MGLKIQSSHMEISNVFFGVENKTARLLDAVFKAIDALKHE